MVGNVPKIESTDFKEHTHNSIYTSTCMHIYLYEIKQFTKWKFLPLQ